MYWFLAIVKKEDVEKGKWVPSYTLCMSHGEADTRSKWRVSKSSSKLKNMPKVLVNSVLDKENMITFLSHYRTRDHMHGSKFKSTKKYYPEGILCWFPCDMYGEQVGPALMIKKVPEKNHKTDQGLEQFREAEKVEKKLWSQLFSAHRDFETLPTKRPILAQPSPERTHFYRR